MNRQRQARSGFTARPALAAVTALALAVLALTGPTSGPAEALTGPSPGPFVGYGFDKYTAPTQALMTAWRGASPYRAVGIYIGGNNRYDQVQPELTPSWVSTQQAAGWHLMPIYLGGQPYCTTSSKIHRFTGANAAALGWSEANDAVVQARRYGLATGSTIFNDIEAYSTTGRDSQDPTLVCTSAVTTAVRTYQSAWTSRLHELGFLSGFYSSTDSGIVDQAAVYSSTAYVRPDYVWFARYDGVATVSDVVLNPGYWQHRRVKQYRSPSKPTPILPETYGGQSLAVDRNYLDVATVPATTVGDFNGNGWSDLIARQTTSSALYLYSGNGTTFTSRTQIGAGWNAMSAITRLGDVNRDGHEDVIAREGATGSLWLYPGTGTGFSPRIRLGWGWNAMREITPVGDFTGDGYPDLLAVQSSTGYLYLYPGHGTSLSARLRIGAGWNAMTELAGVGDFNRDGHVDLLARHSATGVLWLYPGRGASAFLPRLSFGTGWNTMRDLAGVGDFDRDGLNDVIAVETATGKLFRYPGRGTSFGPRLQVGSGWVPQMKPLL